MDELIDEGIPGDGDAAVKAYDEHIAEHTKDADTRSRLYESRMIEDEQTGSADAEATASDELKVKDDPIEREMQALLQSAREGRPLEPVLKAARERRL